MKAIKLFAMMLVALVGMTACSNDDDETKKNVIDPVEGLKGYIFVSSGYFKDSYYGDQATLSVKVKDNQYTITFHDPQWGDVDFENVAIDEAQNTVSGAGTLKMNYRGKDGSYDAVLSGDVNNPTITMPDVMGGTTISFFKGEAPEACLLQGNYSGNTSVMVGETYGPYTVNITCKLTANPDGTINVEIPEHILEGTAIGDLTLGKVTIKDVYYDSAKEDFCYPYGKLKKELTMHFKAERDGAVTMDGDYNFSETSEIEVKKTETGIQIINRFQLGRMPFPIVATFEGAIPSEK